ncbi:toll/interleukin-1 receptor domain-containing protein [Chlorobaculum thiosulfatiphilum]|nr:toll/interleukin-1 receptor domain-containing protein [Chlorobaculum thiosulfatiphilum]
MKEHLRILELAAKNGLPEEMDSASELSIEVVQELVEVGYLKAIDASSDDGISYLEPKITLAGREYLQGLISRKKQENMQENKSEIRLFISHSSTDSVLVEHLVEFLQVALNLSASKIRCTSINGYRLPGGVNTDEQLKREVHEADVLIGVISSDSLQSLYVVFELGARWGAGRLLYPLLVPGTTAKILGGPLAGLNALSIGDRSQLHQLVAELGHVLDIQPEMPAVYDRYIDAIVKQNKSVTSKAEESSNRFDSDDLTAEQTKILQLLARAGDKQLFLQQISKTIQESDTRAEYHVEQLIDKTLISPSYAIGEPPTYCLSKNGRAYLVERNLV